MDLPAYLLPVAVELRNNGGAPLPVQLADFSIIEPGGHITAACRLEDLLPIEPVAPPPQRGPVLATIQNIPLAPSDPDAEVSPRGATVASREPSGSRFALPDGPLVPGERRRGFLFFAVDPEQRAQPLRLRWQAGAAGLLELKLSPR